MPMQIFPEMDMSVEIEDRRSGDLKKIRISGKADRAFAHEIRNTSGSGTVLVAIEAKNPAAFSLARYQLLTYLAIMRQLRRQEGKIVDHVQGFYSDGNNYRFMYIGEEGKVFESKCFDIQFGNDVQIVFNWILHMIHGAAKSSPNTSPTKPGPEQESELSEFESKVFLRLYEPEAHNDGFENLAFGVFFFPPGGGRQTRGDRQFFPNRFFSTCSFSSASSCIKLI
jgi:hypothetical protein